MRLPSTAQISRHLEVFTDDGKPLDMAYEVETYDGHCNAMVFLTNEHGAVAMAPDKNGFLIRSVFNVRLRLRDGAPLWARLRYALWPSKWKMA